MTTTNHDHLADEATAAVRYANKCGDDGMSLADTLRTLTEDGYWAEAEGVTEAHAAGFGEFICMVRDGISDYCFDVEQSLEAAGR